MFGIDKILKTQEGYHKWRVERIKEIEGDFPEIFDVEGKKVLDVGCGAEAPFSYYLSEVKKANVFAGDVSKDFVSSARKFAKKAKISVFPGEKLPYKDNEFEIAYLFDVLEHVKDPLKTVQELKRVTRKGGYIYIKFSPFYAYPTGPHLYSLGFPRGLFPFQFLPRGLTRRVIFNKKRLGTKDTPQFLYDEFKALNKISVSNFLKIIKETNLRVVRENMYIMLPNGKINITFFSKIPLLREILAMGYDTLLINDD
ncbi:MAG: class I SAM-dependent methyltransferase [Nanoarchaeota archaeon]